MGAAEVIELVKTGGLPAFLLYLWFMERAERIKERERNEVLAREQISATVKVESALNTMNAIFSSAGGKPAP